MSKVALFYRRGRPHRLASASLLLIENFDTAVLRTVRHRGFLDRVATIRPQASSEKEVKFTRYHLEYYGSWEELIADEQRIYDDDPSIGREFLDDCIAMSQDGKHPVSHCMRRKPPDVAALEAALIAETKHLDGPLDAFEKRVVRDTAARIGATQLDLFGPDPFL